MELHYDKEVDILMIVLSNRKIDDSYETDYGVVSIDKNGEPVMIDIYKASKYLKGLKKDLTKKQFSQAQASIAHRIK